MYLFLLVTNESFDFDNNRSPIIMLIIKNELFQLYIKAVGNFCRGGWSTTQYNYKNVIKEQNMVQTIIVGIRGRTFLDLLFFMRGMRQEVRRPLVTLRNFC